MFELNLAALAWSKSKLSRQNPRSPGKNPPAASYLTRTRHKNEYMMTLDKGKCEKIYQILGFCGGDSAVLRRFFELGFTTGERVKIVSTSLQKKVLLIEIRGYLLSVRTNLLSCVQVKE